MFLDSRWVLGFAMDIQDGFQDSRWGSWIYDGFLDSPWVAGFSMGSWFGAQHGAEIFATARIIRARHGNPPPPVKGGTGVFFNRHGTPKSPVLERL